ncbi:sulfotransferase [Chachezhania antarctica]|uniref:sulfotransferase n=1 Tax=Chachezhania antarctica TaxID=2340860 RepID=UPI0013CE837E|nr:sulfotransferase [Chachezhania antarctica]
MSAPKRVILVTGSPRSGTTAIGQYLSLPGNTAPLHEPLNGITGLSRVSRHYEIPGTAGFDDTDLEEIVHGIRHLKLTYKKRGYDREKIHRKIAARLVGHRPRLSYLAAKYRFGIERLIWKDPFALPLLGHPAMQDIPSVVTVRNPFAVAASYKRMRWGNDADEVAGRLDALGAWSAPCLPKSFGAEGYSAAENAALLWSVNYRRAVEAFRARDNLWFVDIDDVIAQPVGVYRTLYRHLDIPWTDGIEQQIRAAYTAPAEGSATTEQPKENKAHDQNRDISKVNSYWTSVLTEEEAARVGELTGETAAMLAETPMVDGKEG